MFLRGGGGLGMPTDVPRPPMWIPAFRGFGGERYFLPEHTYDRDGQGLIASVWSVQQLLHPSNVWARLIMEAGSDEEFTEDLHYEVTDFAPTHVLFSRMDCAPVDDRIKHVTASELMAQEVYLFQRDPAAQQPRSEGPPGPEWWQTFATPSTPSTPSSTNSLD